jgi:hypothetical protein
VFARITSGVKADGTPRVVSKTLDTRAEAESWLISKSVELSRELSRPAGVTLRVLWDAYKEHRRSIPELRIHDKLYNVWRGVKKRCLNPNHYAYDLYGQRGITICSEWMRFECFYKWALENGITTMKTVEDARLDEPLTRAELAKMMVVYIQKVLKKDPVVT